MRLPPKDPAETKMLRFVFGADLADGETIASVTVSAATEAGVDASPANVLMGSPTVSGGDVLQRVHGGLAGCDYRLRCLATTSAGLVHLASGCLPVRPLL